MEVCGRVYGGDAHWGMSGGFPLDTWRGSLKPMTISHELLQIVSSITHHVTVFRRTMVASCDVKILDVSDEFRLTLERMVAVTAVPLKIGRAHV